MALFYPYLSPNAAWGLLKQPFQAKVRQLCPAVFGHPSIQEYAAAESRR
jgi:hypothetical protein